jgi:hypothetical protein
MTRAGLGFHRITDAKSIENQTNVFGAPAR